jgi:hypothetical protein
MGVNKNSCILIILIVSGLTQVLVFIESVLVKKKRGGVYVNWWWIDEWMMDSLKISAF